MRLLHTERRWDGIPESPITANGQEDGLITVADTAYYKAKMYVILKSDSYQPVRYQIQRVLSRTQMILGLTPQEFTERKKKQKNTTRTVDLTRWLTSDNTTITAPEQARPNIPHEDYERARQAHLVMEAARLQGGPTDVRREIEELSGLFNEVIKVLSEDQVERLPSHVIDYIDGAIIEKLD